MGIPLPQNCSYLWLTMTYQLRFNIHGRYAMSCSALAVNRLSYTRDVETASSLTKCVVAHHDRHDWSRNCNMILQTFYILKAIAVKVSVAIYVINIPYIKYINVPLPFTCSLDLVSLIHTIKSIWGQYHTSGPLHAIKCRPHRDHCITVVGTGMVVYLVAGTLAYRELGEENYANIALVT